MLTQNPKLNNKFMNGAISFSLYGDQPKYIEGIFENLRLKKQYYPDLDVLVYVDASISESLASELRLNGAKVVRPSCAIPPMYFRLFAMDSLDYDYILYRDADSRFSDREKHSVDEWLRSGAALHVMRDHPNHHTPIMAGMFGTFRCRHIPINDLLIKNAPLTFTYGDDERFLAEHIWPLLKDDSFINDSNGANQFHVCNKDQMHVGQQMPWHVRKAVVIATTDDDDYFANAAFCIACWHRIGWQVILIHRGERQHNTDADVCINLKGESRISDASIAQLSRLFAGHLACNYDMLMTADVDMMPLYDAWHPKYREITVYGKDLTCDKQQCPLCYIAMHPSRWISVTGATGNIIRDCEAAFDKAIEPWFADQEFITERLNKEKVIYIDRGFAGTTNLAVDRMDRVNWGHEWDRPIDAHMPRPFNQDNFNCLKLT